MKQLSFSEWLTWRRAGIGSSDAPAIMGASPWAKPRDVWANKTGRAPAQKRNHAMKRGLEMEPIARDAYQQMTGIAMPAICLEHVGLPFVRASVDGLSDIASRILEIKCPGKKDHAEARAGRIPAKYRWQLVHLLLASGFERCDYFSFDGVRGVIIPFERNEKLERELLDAETRFWKLVTDDVPPPEVTTKAESESKSNVLSIFKVRRSR